MVGEDVLEKHKVRIVINFHVLILDQGMLKELVKKRFREKASVFLGDQDNFLQSFQCSSHPDQSLSAPGCWASACCASRCPPAASPNPPI